MKRYIEMPYYRKKSSTVYAEPVTENTNFPDNFAVPEEERVGKILLVKEDGTWSLWEPDEFNTKFEEAPTPAWAQPKNEQSNG
jgi:hypothetical protein